MPGSPSADRSAPHVPHGNYGSKRLRERHSNCEQARPRERGPSRLPAQRSASTTITCFTTASDHSAWTRNPPSQSAHGTKQLSIWPRSVSMSNKQFATGPIRRPLRGSLCCSRPDKQQQHDVRPSLLVVPVAAQSGSVTRCLFRVKASVSSTGAGLLPAPNSNRHQRPDRTSALPRSRSPAIARYRPPVGRRGTRGVAEAGGAPDRTRRPVFRGCRSLRSRSTSRPGPSVFGRLRERRDSGASHERSLGGK
jgi:hypothetical protein